MTAITKHRGDTKPIVFQLWEDKTAGVALDITDFTFTFTVNVKKAPVVTDAPEFSLTGELVGAATDGQIRFLPTESNMDLIPKTYYYDLEVTDADGYKSTEVLNSFKVIQDITK